MKITLFSYFFVSKNTVFASSATPVSWLRIPRDAAPNSCLPSLKLAVNHRDFDGRIRTSATADKSRAVERHIVRNLARSIDDDGNQHHFVPVFRRAIRIHDVDELRNVVERVTVEVAHVVGRGERRAVVHQLIVLEEGI